MDCYNLHENKEKISVLKKIILSYLEQFMAYHIDEKVFSIANIKNFVEDKKLKTLFRVLSKGFLLNIEQFLKSRKWIKEADNGTLKNITITSINIIPKDEEEGPLHFRKQSETTHTQFSPQTSSSLSEIIYTPSGTGVQYEDPEPEKGSNPTYIFEPFGSYVNSLDLPDFENMPGFILGKLNFVSLSLSSIKKLLEKSKGVFQYH